MGAALAIHNLGVRYGRGVSGIRSLSLEVPVGAMVALLGANGAGKTTTLRAVSGMLPLEGGRVVQGSYELFGENVDGLPPHKIVHRGLFHAREGRHVFGGLTVEENLVAATFARGRRAPRARSFDDVYSYFPRLAERRKQKAGYLSGGEQQMLVLGRAIVAEPRLLLLDEPSLGLAPKVVDDLFRIIARIQDEKKLSVLLVEQNASVALRWVSYGYVIENGAVAMQGDAEALRASPDMRSHYLGGEIALEEPNA